MNILTTLWFFKIPPKTVAASLSPSPRFNQFLSNFFTQLIRETAAALAIKGATVIMACRNIQLAEQVAETIRSEHPGALIIVGPKLDLASQESVRAFASAYIEKGWPLHVLVNNAGAIDNGEPWYTQDGVGGLCQINYLGKINCTQLLT
jgi:NAD(P)-dependent dehydrogenase (short-subunit alcohol dehydrogenase family)